MSFDTQAARSLTGSVFGSLQKARLDTVLVAACAEIDRLRAALRETLWVATDLLAEHDTTKEWTLAHHVAAVERARVALGEDDKEEEDFDG